MEPTFHEFSPEWFAARESEGLAVKTLVDLRWSLSNHLLPYFAARRLSVITPQDVDRYKTAKAKGDTWHLPYRSNHVPLAAPHVREPPCCACGDDVRYTADQLGHEDPRFTLRVYSQAVKRRDRLAKPQREAFDRAIEWAAMGSSDDLTLPMFHSEATKNPVTGAFKSG